MTDLEPQACLFELQASLGAAARASGRPVLDAGRGQPNWVATLPREAHLELTAFALAEPRRSRRRRRPGPSHRLRPASAIASAPPRAIGPPPARPAPSCSSRPTATSSRARLRARRLGRRDRAGRARLGVSHPHPDAPPHRGGGRALHRRARRAPSPRRRAPTSCSPPRAARRPCPTCSTRCGRTRSCDPVTPSPWPPRSSPPTSRSPCSRTSGSGWSRSRRPTTASSASRTMPWSG